MAAKSRKGTQNEMRHDVSLLGEQDLFLFNEGSHLCMQEKLGSHLHEVDGESGVYFGVWAPNAREVSVVGDFNDWNKSSHPLAARGRTGIWEGFIGGIGKGAAYKYFVASRHQDYATEKADPYAVHFETSPGTASKVWDLNYQWYDREWMSARHKANGLEAPIAVYELHLGSWRRKPEEGNRSLSYREAAPLLIEHLQRTGFTHVELLPIMEHPFYGSWGYQCTGYFAPTSRYGTPQDLMYLIDQLHQHGFGVILDWVPSHFPSDEHGLAYFDGTHLYEHADPRQGIHRDWNSYIFNYGRHEVRSFLLSSAMYWLDYYHADGLRVDAVASMLYLDYSRQQGEWVPNKYGGRENLEAIDFLRRFNSEVYGKHPDVQTYAEESTAWPMVARPTYVGGLGFGFKWDMGWMHDTLHYMAREPIFRQYHHHSLTFRAVYAFSENFILPLSHDEAVHGKGSLLGKMPGSREEKFANLRLLYGLMYAQPAKKLLFMGGEFGQWSEWAHDSSLDWHLLGDPQHERMMQWVGDLNAFYRSEAAMHELDCSPEGFEWIDCNDTLSGVISLIRKSRRDPAHPIIAIFNCTPVLRPNYRVGAPHGGFWREALNSDAERYGGWNHGNFGGCEAAPFPHHGRPWTLSLTVPPFGCLFLKSEGA